MKKLSLFVLFLCGIVSSYAQLNNVNGRTATIKDSFFVNGKWYKNLLIPNDTLKLRQDINAKLNPADTIKLRQDVNTKLAGTDTISLSNRINARLTGNDTVKLRQDVNTKLAGNDTVSLSNRINARLSGSDTLKLRQDVNTKLGGNDTISLSNRINARLSGNDTLKLRQDINNIGLAKYVYFVQHDYELASLLGGKDGQIIVTGDMRRWRWDSACAVFPSVGGIDTIAPGTAAVGRWIVQKSYQFDVTGLPDSLAAQNIALAFAKGNTLNSNTALNAGGYSFGIQTDSFTLAGSGSSTKFGVISQPINGALQTTVTGQTALSMGVDVARSSWTYDSTSSSTAVPFATLALSYPTLEVLTTINSVPLNKTMLYLDSVVGLPKFIAKTKTVFDTCATKNIKYTLLDNEEVNDQYRIIDTTLTPALYIAAMRAYTTLMHSYNRGYLVGNGGFTGDPALWVAWNWFIQQGRTADAAEFAYTAFTPSKRNTLSTWATTSSSTIRKYNIICCLKLIAAYKNMNFDVMNLHVALPSNGVDTAGVNPRFFQLLIEAYTKMSGKPVIINELGANSITPTYLQSMMQALSANNMPRVVVYDGTDSLTHADGSGKDVALRNQTDNTLNNIGIGARDKYTILKQALRGILKGYNGKAYLPSTATGVRQLLTIEADSSIGTASFSSAGGATTDTTSILYWRGVITNLDSTALKAGQYNVTSATTGTRPAGATTTGTVYFSPFGGTSWAANKNATMVFVGIDGKSFGRGFNGTVWSGWYNPTTDTTNMLYARGNIGNFDTTNVAVGQYTYNNTTRGTFPGAGQYGTVWLLSSVFNNVFNGSQGATMIAIDRSSGSSYTRGFNGSAWSAWKGGGIDTTSIEYYNAAIGNYDTLSLKGGVYSYNTGTTGTRATNMTTGQLYFSANVARDWSGSTVATMFAVNSNGLIFSRGFNGTAWSTWRTIQNVDTSRIVYAYNDVVNFDTLSLNAGNYTYTTTTRGARPGGTTIGTMQFEKTGTGLLWDGTTRATMRVHDQGNKLYWRAYNSNTSSWSAWKVSVDSAGVPLDSVTYIINRGTQADISKIYVNPASSLSASKIAADSSRINNGYTYNLTIGGALVAPLATIYSSTVSRLVFNNVATGGTLISLPIYHYPSAVGETIYGINYNAIEPSSSVGNSYIVGHNSTYKVQTPGTDVFYGYRANIGYASYPTQWARKFVGYQVDSVLTGTGGSSQIADTIIGFRMQPVNAANPKVWGVWQSGSNVSNILEGSVFNTPNLPAYSSGGYGKSIVINTTSGNQETITDKDVAEQSYTGTVLFAGATTNPATPTNTYYWSQHGKVVTVWFNLSYATAGAAVSSLELPFPADLPAPYIPTNVSVSAALNKLGAVGVADFTAGTTTQQNNGKTYIIRNTANTGYAFLLVFASNAGKVGSAMAQYRTN